MVDLKFSAGIIPKNQTSVKFSGVVATTGGSNSNIDVRKLAVELMGLCTPSRVIGEGDLKYWGKAATDSPTYHNSGSDDFPIRYFGDPRKIMQMYMPILDASPLLALQKQLPGSEAEQADLMARLCLNGVICTKKPQSAVSHTESEVHPLVCMAAMKAKGNLGRVEETFIRLPQAFKEEFPEFTKLSSLPSVEDAEATLRQAMRKIEDHEPHYWGMATLYKPLLDYIANNQDGS